MSAQGSVTARTAHGAVSGQELDSGVLVFKGIPYAAPPAGNDRFAAPRPPASWAGVLDGSRFAATAPQPGYEGAIAELLPNVTIDGENSLNLNVWTPGTDGKRPVMVFIHGGAFVNGSGSVPGYDGAAFARDGVVLVTLNYRLGFEGFGWVDGAVQNRGLLDQVAALNWVQQNIAGFGGDPQQVTVFGESAGAMSIGCLLAMPQARGLFQRAILQSGAAHNVLTVDAARKTARKMAGLLQISPTPEAFGDIDGAELVRAQSALRAGPAWRRRLMPGVLGSVLSSTMLFQPVVDGTVLPRRPIEAIRDGVADDVEILVGTNSEEARLYLVPGGVLDRVTRATLWVIAAAVARHPRSAIAALRKVRPTATPGDMLEILMTYRLFRLPALRLAAAHPRAWLYEFTWRSPSFGGELGACHALELAFVFDLLDHPLYRGLTDGAGPQDLADRVHAAWVDFASSGDPGWAPFDAGVPLAERLGPDGPWVAPLGTDPRIEWRGDI